ncbi:MAG: carbohydrate-binding protein [Planctomycetes bacterium]|nr:carbohydrate-binding protein [Planctomycetota bacterium]
MRRLTAVASVILALAAAVVAGTPPPEFQILVFTRTAGFRHRSIPDGVASLRDLGREYGFAVEHTEDPARFTDARLARFDAVVFLSTTGDVLDETQQAAFERYVRAGGGYVGIHAASDTEYEWPWYGRLVGAYFKSHPRVQDATIIVTDRTHPSTIHLPERWDRHDEWYDYRDNPRGKVHVLATLDERTYEGGRMGRDHPTAWCHVHDGGRAWYTGGGHTSESFAEPAFRRHMLGGIWWAAGRTDALEGRSEVVLQPGRKQAEYARAREGTRVARSDDPDGGGQVLVFERDGAHASYRPVDLRRIVAIDLRVADGAAGGTLELRLDAPDGALLGAVTAPPRSAPPEAGGRAVEKTTALRWTTKRVPITDPGGTHALFVVRRPGADDGTPMMLNWLQFVGQDPADE